MKLPIPGSARSLYGSLLMLLLAFGPNLRAWAKWTPDASPTCTENGVPGAPYGANCIEDTCCEGNCVSLQAPCPVTPLNCCDVSSGQCCSYHLPFPLERIS